MVENNLVHYIVGYKKTPNKFGNFEFAVKYQFNKPISLSFLQKTFGINPNILDLAERHMLYCYPIDKYIANTLQPYCKEKLDFEKYSLMLECTSSEEYSKGDSNYNKK